MKPREYIGKQVTAHHPRGGHIHGVVVKTDSFGVYGRRLVLACGRNVALSDVIRVEDTELEVMARHYVIACIWADCEEGTRPRATAQAMQAAREDCAEFIAYIGAERMQAIRDAYDEGYGAHPDCGNVHPWMAAMGRDFYLTRQGHGVGFGDRDALPEDLREWLDDACGFDGEFKEIYPQFYRGWLYLR